MSAHALQVMPLGPLLRAVLPKTGEWRYSWLYFVQEDSPEGYIKIGITTQPTRRMVVMQNGNPRPLKVLGLFWTYERTEPDLHKLFTKMGLHVAGEWFKPDAAIFTYIDLFRGSGLEQRDPE